jgi:hypothetical protein
MLTGEFVPLSYVLHERTAGRQQHRPLIKKGTRLVCKISCLIPRRTHSRDPDRTLFVTTGPDSLLRYGLREDVCSRLVLNADHLRRRRLGYRRRLDRLMEDRKRYPRGSNTRRNINISVARRSLKEGKRLHDFCHKTAKMLIDFAVRQGVGRIEYDGTDKTYISEFPWFKLQTLLEQKAAQENIKFIASAEVVSAEQGALAAS